MESSSQSIGSFVRLSQQKMLGDFYNSSIESGFRNMAKSTISHPIVLSPDYRHIISLHKSGDNIEVFVDGDKKEVFSWVNDRSIVFSPNGKRYAYVGLQSDGDEVVVVDGVKGTPYPSIWELSLSFSLDNNHIRYEYATKKPSGALAIAKVVTVGLIRALLPGPFLPGTKVVTVIDGDEVSKTDTCNIPLTEKGEENWPRSRGEYFPMKPGYEVVSPNAEWICKNIKKSFNEYLIQVKNKKGDTAIGTTFDKIIGEIIFDSSKSFHYIACRGATHYFLKEYLLDNRFDPKKDFTSQIESVIDPLRSDLDSEEVLTIYLSRPDCREGEISKGCILSRKNQWFYFTDVLSDFEIITANHPVLLVVNQCFSQDAKIKAFVLRILPKIYPNCISNKIVIIWSNTRKSPEIKSYLRPRNLPLKGCFFVKEGNVIEYKNFRKWFSTNNNQLETIQKLLSEIQELPS